MNIALWVIQIVLALMFGMAGVTKISQPREALQAKLRDQALRDPLTGVFNRRFLAETLARETARARRDSRAYAVVILDLDHFKQVNDTHGHEAGDRVLVAAAELLRSHTREGDLVCRYGGEEFVVLMPGASAVSAARRAELWEGHGADDPLTATGRHRLPAFPRSRSAA